MTDAKASGQNHGQDSLNNCPTDLPTWPYADPSGICKQIRPQPVGTERWRWLLQIHWKIKTEDFRTKKNEESIDPTAKMTNQVNIISIALIS